MSKIAVLIVAAGRGQRLGGQVPKQYQSLAGTPILRRTILLFLPRTDIDTVLVVIHPDDRALYDAAVGDLPLPPPVAGGATRQRSVRNGLEAMAADDARKPDLVMIHDGARPFTDPGTIARIIAALAVSDGAVAAVAVNDTVKRAAGAHIIETVPRAGLWRAQTPQGFRFPSILAAHRDFGEAVATDDAAIAEAAGLTVQIVPSSEANIKVTSPDDMIRAEQMIAAAMETRVGTGFDVHRFGPGDHVMLCGVRIPHTQGLLGHSDADVALHALVDAMLGAIAAGDIGMHFPPSDPRWANAESGGFVTYARDLIRARGGRISNADLTVICERPRLAERKAAMGAAVARLLEIDRDRVNIKATTTEKLGFAGRGEGIAAQAVVTVRLPADSSQGAS